MERLTKRTIYGEGCPIQVMTNQVFHNICDRLAYIEDILGDDYDLDRLRELADSDRDGRCIIIPDFVWKV